MSSHTICMVGTCSNVGSKRGVSYFRLTEDRRKSWLQALNRDPDEPISKWNRICSRHFAEEDKTETITGKIQLSQGAIPKVNIPGRHQIGSSQHIISPTMAQCSVRACENKSTNTKGGNIKYFRFPRDPIARAKWIETCGREIDKPTISCICSIHFAETAYEDSYDTSDILRIKYGYPAAHTRILRKDAVPTENLHHSPQVAVNADLTIADPLFIECASSGYSTASNELDVSICNAVIKQEDQDSSENISEKEENSVEYWKAKYLAAKHQIEGLQNDIIIKDKKIADLNDILSNSSKPRQILIMNLAKKQKNR